MTKYYIIIFILLYILGHLYIGNKFYVYLFTNIPMIIHTYIISNAHTYY